jgi:hypothetical protein
MSTVFIKCPCRPEFARFLWPLLLLWLLANQEATAEQFISQTNLSHDKRMRVAAIPSLTPNCWTEDTFDNLFLGCLDGKNGWMVVPGRSCAFVISNPFGSGQVLQIRGELHKRPFGRL